MPTCKKTVYQAVKVNTVDGTVEVIGDAFDFTGVTIDPATLGNCPDVENVTNSVCVTEDGTNCVEGVKQICQVAYDCATEESTVTVLGYVLPDSTFLATADAVAPFAVIPCPEYSIVTDSKCEISN